MQKVKINLLWVSVGFLVLLLYGYFDSIRFPLIPIFSKVFEIDYAHTSLFLAFGYLGSIISSVFILFLVYKYSLKNIAAILLTLILLICVGAYIVTGYLSLILYGAIYGALITLLNSLSNMIILNNTPPHLSGKYISGGQALYGLSCICVPWIVAKIFISDIGWRWCFYLAIPFTAFILILVLICKYRDEHDHSVAHRDDVKHHHRVTLREVKLTILEKVSVLMFSIYVAGEVIGVSWMTTILIKKYGYTVDSAKSIVTMFFVLFTICRLLCVKISTPNNEKLMILSSLLGCTICFILGGYLSPLFFIGFGIVSPVYPLFMANITRRDPLRTNALAIWILVCTQLIVCVLTFSMGRVIDTLGVNTASMIPPAILILAWLGLCKVIPSSKKVKV